MRCRFFAFAGRLAALAVRGAAVRLRVSLGVPLGLRRRILQGRRRRIVQRGHLGRGNVGRRGGEGRPDGIGRRRFAGGHGRRGPGDRCRCVGRGECVGRSRRDGFRRGLGLHRSAAGGAASATCGGTLASVVRAADLFGARSTGKPMVGHRRAAMAWARRPPPARRGAPRAPAGPARGPAQTPFPVGRPPGGIAGILLVGGPQQRRGA